MYYLKTLSGISMEFVYSKAGEKHICDITLKEEKFYQNFPKTNKNPSNN